MPLAWVFFLFVCLFCRRHCIVHAGLKRALKAEEHSMRRAILDTEQLSFRDLVSFVVDLVPVSCESSRANYVPIRQGGT